MENGSQSCLRSSVASAKHTRCFHDDSSTKTKAIGGDRTATTSELSHRISENQVTLVVAMGTLGASCHRPRGHLCPCLQQSLAASNIHTYLLTAEVNRRRIHTRDAVSGRETGRHPRSQTCCCSHATYTGTLSSSHHHHTPPTTHPRQWISIMTNDNSVHRQTVQG